MMEFREPSFLLLIPAAWIILLFVFFAAERRRKRLLSLLTPSAAAIHLSRKRRSVKYFLLLFAVTFALFGAARPYRERVLIPQTGEGQDVIVLFDVSKSMRAADLPPSRMDQAKFLLRQVIADSPGTRFALVPFAGNAFLSAPLTEDHAALEEFIDELSPDSVPRGGTDIERAVRTALRAFEGAGGNNRAILLLSDGEELSGEAAGLAALLREKRIPLFAVGFGNPRADAPVPDGQGGVMRGADGKLALSRLREEPLRFLTEASGGSYWHSTVTDPGISAVEKAISSLGKEKRAGKNRFVPKECFPLFFAAALLCLIAGALIPERKDFPVPKGKRMVLWIALAFLLPLTGAEPDADALYNQAREKQMAGDASAAEEYESLIRSFPGRPDLQSRAFQNLGVMEHEKARAQFRRGQELTAAQQIDPALEALEKGKQSLEKALELYSGALVFEEAQITGLASDLRQREVDLRRLEEWQKKLEELKKQQQKAQQETQKAQQQNQQNQQNRQNRQQTESARQAAEKLADQAKELGQKELAGKASQAEKELREAAQKQAENRPDEAEKHLKNAAQALGVPEKQEGEGKEEEPSPSEKRMPEKEKPAASAEKQDQAGEKKEKSPRNGDEALRLLDQEGKEFRDALRRKKAPRIAPVEKDW